MFNKYLRDKNPQFVQIFTFDPVKPRESSKVRVSKVKVNPTFYPYPRKTKNQQASKVSHSRPDRKLCLTF